MAELSHGDQDSNREELKKVIVDCQSLAHFVIDRSYGPERYCHSFAHIGVDINQGVGLFLQLSSVLSDNQRAARVGIVEYPKISDTNVRVSYGVEGECITVTDSEVFARNGNTLISWPTLFDAPQLQACLEEIACSDDSQTDIDPLSLQAEIDAIYTRATPHIRFEAAKFSLDGLAVVVARRVHAMPTELANLLEVGDATIDEYTLNVLLDEAVIGRTKITRERGDFVVRGADSARAMAKLYRDRFKELEDGVIL